MRLIIQRCTRACVTVDNHVTGAIEKGLMILVGVAVGDTEEDVEWLVSKTLSLRIFDDDNGVMNRSVMDVGGEILAVSQFTLHASTRKGNRPSYIKAARPETAVVLYESYCRRLSEQMGKNVEQGIFGAHMKVELVNDGPVTIIIDSRLRE
ncbi:MAG: D-tyrosyl-tRNA(Tyr) deacylase [Muribaculaceae bacterium]|nr:D-tyrosyl-tRNA(Tyr) deacylase [Muribaculaceae bacterium]